MTAAVIGIDPGTNGGIAVLAGEDHTAATVYRMPRTERDLWMLVEAIAHRHHQCRAVIERVSSSPQMGVASSFKFGLCYGQVRMAFVAAGIPLEEITPLHALQRSGCKLHHPPYPKDPAAKRKARTERQRAQKAHTRAQMQQRYPRALTPDTRGLTLAVADALMIACAGAAT